MQPMASTTAIDSERPLHSILRGCAIMLDPPCGRRDDRRPCCARAPSSRGRDERGEEGGCVQRRCPRPPPRGWLSVGPARGTGAPVGCARRRVAHRGARHAAACRVAEVRSVPKTRQPNTSTRRAVGQGAYHGAGSPRRAPSHRDAAKSMCVLFDRRRVKCPRRPGAAGFRRGASPASPARKAFDPWRSVDAWSSSIRRAPSSALTPRKRWRLGRRRRLGTVARMMPGMGEMGTKERYRGYVVEADPVRRRGRWAARAVFEIHEHGGRELPGSPGRSVRDVRDARAGQSGVDDAGQGHPRYAPSAPAGPRPAPRAGQGGLTRAERRCRFGGGRRRVAPNRRARLTPSHGWSSLEENEDHMVNVTVYTNVG